MRKFIDTQLITLLRKSAEQSVSDLEWEQAYDEFASLVFATSIASVTIAYHNSLCYAKAELDLLYSQCSWRKKKGNNHFVPCKS
jgi:hypothetical protein